MTKKTKSWLANHAATILGLTVAVLDAYQNIDWTNFDWRKEWIRLLIDGGIAVGGYLSKFSFKSDAQAANQ